MTSDKARLDWIARRAKITKCDGTFIWMVAIPGMGYSGLRNGIDAAMTAEKKSSKGVR